MKVKLPPNQSADDIKTIELQTKCPCGADLKFEARKPGLFRPELTKADCVACGSKFVIKTKAGKSRQVDIDIGIQELSSKCKDILQGTIDDRDKKKVKRVVEGGTSETLETPSDPKGA